MSSARAAFVDRIWSLVGSPRLAFGLTLSLGLVGVLSTVVAQAPDQALATAESYRGWVLAQESTYGSWVGMLSALGIFRLADAPYTRFLVGSLIACTSVCTINRLPSLLRVALADTPAHFGDPRLGGVESDDSPHDEVGESVIESISAALRSKRFRVRVAPRGSGWMIEADRNRLAALGTIATHFGVVLLLIWVYVSGAWGVRVTGFAIPEGTSRRLPFDPNQSVWLEEYVERFAPDGAVIDYRAEVAIIESGAVVSSGTIGVNSPLTSHGTDVLLESSGQAVGIHAVPADGSASFDDAITLDRSIGGQPAGSLRSIDGTTLIVVHSDGAAGSAGTRYRIEMITDVTSSGSAYVAIGEAAVLPLAEITITDSRRFASFQLIRDSGAPILWAAALAMVLGMAVVFAFPYSRFDVLVTVSDTGSWEARIIEPAGRGHAMTAGEIESAISHIIRIPGNRRAT